MEAASGAVCRPSSGFPVAGRVVRRSVGSVTRTLGFGRMRSYGGIRLSAGVSRVACPTGDGRSLIGDFSDEGHLKYYGREDTDKKEGELVRSREDLKSEKKKVKKKLKLIEGLVEDLSELLMMEDLGSGVGEGVGLREPGKERKIAEAAKALLTQLEQLRCEEKEMKKMEKQAKEVNKAAKKVFAKWNAEGSCGSSSSSSSESSESDCEGKTVRMKDLRTQQQIVTGPQCLAAPEPLPLEKDSLSGVQLNATEVVLNVASALNSPTALSDIKENLGDIVSGVNVMIKGNKIESVSMFDIASNVAIMSAATTIEVCMGGKCKKSGGPELLEAFEKALGDDGFAVGCKCMGKCKQGPNVRVLTGSVLEEAGTGAAGNEMQQNNDLNVGFAPLCVGVGLEDVDLIVANYFGKRNAGLLAA